MWEKEGGFSVQTWVKVEPYKYKPIIDSFQALASSPASTADLDSMSGPVKAQGRDKPDYTLVNSLLNLSKSEVNIKLVNFFFNYFEITLYSLLWSPGQSEKLEWITTLFW